MTCPKCGQDNPAEARFCAICGSNLDAAVGTPASSLSMAPVSSAGTPPAEGTERQSQISALGYWASWAAVVTALLAVAVLTGGAGIWLLIPIALGACLWAAVTGKWPGTRRRVHPALRAVLGLIGFAINGFVASIVGLIYACPDGLLCGGLGPAAGAGIGLGFFVGFAAAELVTLLLAVGAFKLIRYLWRRARYYRPPQEVPNALR